MNDLKNILAKSVLYGGTSLLDHTQHVVACIEKMVNSFLINVSLEIARKGAILHDLGKAHPKFQSKVHSENKESLFSETEDDSYTHRHEISSLPFLICFPKEEWPYLIDMVVAHHKPILNDSRLKGILDIKTNDRRWIKNHLIEWEKWYPYGIQIIESFGYQCPETISEGEAAEVLNYVADYCEKKKMGWSPYRGLLKAADHFASAFMDKTQEALKHTFEMPDLSFYYNENRKNPLYPLSLIDTSDLRPHTMVVASTGAGKTDFLMKRTRGRVFYTLPFQASINAMWTRFKEDVPNQDIRVLHSTSKITVGKYNIEEQLLQPLTGSSIKVLTPHQLAGIVFGISGYESILIDVMGCDIILDEIHTYSGISRSMVIEIVKALKSVGCRIHIGTATMPSVLYKELFQILGGETEVYEVSLSDKELDSFNRHEIYKLETKECMYPIIRNSVIENKDKVLLVFNTIEKAQKAYTEIKEAFRDIPSLLIHSRFRRKDRFEKELKLKNIFNGKGEYKGLSPCIVVATQVVEVSLDISFDLMITECAPLDSLIQRFGRINRVRNAETIHHYKPVYVIAPKGNSLPYKSDRLKSSFSELPDKGQVLQEKQIQQMIDNVYPELDSKLIDIHLKFRNNQFLMKELTDNKKSILIDALEIEGATCILESDRENYLNADWQDRIDLEIPVRWKTIVHYIKEYEQLNLGSNPFVIPQSKEEYEKYGLQLVERDIIL